VNKLLQKVDNGRPTLLKVIFYKTTTASRQKALSLDNFKSEVSVLTLQGNIRDSVRESVQQVLPFKALK
jgi:hypothetical protein